MSDPVFLDLSDDALTVVEVDGPSGLGAPSGPQGYAGWSPVLATITDGPRRVLKLIDWTGGAGAKPAILSSGLAQYLGASGFTTTLASATDVRGAQGDQGVQGIQGIQGLTGPIGLTGPAGPTGAAGPAGTNALLRAARTSNTMLGAVDKGSLVDVTGTFTQTFDTASALGSGWWVLYRNAGTGLITIPASDGVTNWIMYPGEVRRFVSDGSNLYSLLLNGGQYTFTASGTFIWPPGVVGLIADVVGAGAGGGSCAGSANGGYGGGGGGRIMTSMPIQAAGTSTTVTVGAGGAGSSSATSGGNGGASSFANLLASGGNAAGTGGGGGVAPPPPPPPPRQHPRLRLRRRRHHFQQRPAGGMGRRRRGHPEHRQRARVVRRRLGVWRRRRRRRRGQHSAGRGRRRRRGGRL